MAETDTKPEASSEEAPVAEEITPDMQKSIVKQLEVSDQSMHVFGLQSLCMRYDARLLVSP